MAGDQAKPRFYVALDVSNLWKSCQERYGEAARVDFRVLSEMLPTLYPEPIQQRLVAYVVMNQMGSQQKPHAFVSVLHSFGYLVKQQFLHRVNKTRTLYTDWNVGITIDAVAGIDDYDTFVLMSGDGDFSLLLEFLRDRGKKTMVMAFPTSISNTLNAAADELIPLTHSAVFGLDNTATSLDNEGGENSQN